jgi:DNA-binding NarL/FixJ family response regulator
MAPARTIDQALSELRRFRHPRFRRVRVAEAVPLLARLLASCHTLGVEERAGGIAFRLQSEADAPAFLLTCVLHHTCDDELTTAERAVAGQLCEGRTLAQIAHLRGVSANTVKSQVRQIFRKLNVDTRVALVRRLCP